MSKTSRSVTVPTVFPAPDPDARSVGKDANAVDVAVFYDKGGTNMFSGNNDKRGYWASFKPVTVEKADYPGGFDSKSFVLFDKRGGKVFLEPANRFSAKTLDKLAEPVLAKADALAKFVADDNIHEAVRLAKGLAPDAPVKEVS